MGQVNVNPGGDTGGSGAATGTTMMFLFSLIILIVLLVVAYLVLWPMLSSQPSPLRVNVNVRSSDLRDVLTLLA